MKLHFMHWTFVTGGIWLVGWFHLKTQTSILCLYLSAFPTCRLNTRLRVSRCLAAACCPSATLTWRNQTISVEAAATPTLRALRTQTPEWSSSTPWAFHSLWRGKRETAVRIPRDVLTVCWRSDLQTLCWHCRRFSVLNPTNKAYSFKWTCENTGACPFRCLTPSGTLQPGKKVEVRLETSRVSFVFTVWLWPKIFFICTSKCHRLYCIYYLRHNIHASLSFFNSLFLCVCSYVLNTSPSRLSWWRSRPGTLWLTVCPYPSRSFALAHQENRSSISANHTSSLANFSLVR